LQIDVDDLLEIGAHMIDRFPDGGRSFSLSGLGGNPLIWLVADSPDDLIAVAGVPSDVAADWAAELRGEAVDDGVLAAVVGAETAAVAPAAEALARMLNHANGAAHAVLEQDARS